MLLKFKRGDRVRVAAHVTHVFDVYISNPAKLRGHIVYVDMADTILPYNVDFTDAVGAPMKLWLREKDLVANGKPTYGKV